MQLTNKHYIEKVKKNKKTAFLHHYEPVHNQLYKYCRAVSGNTEDAEDLIQDTILNVLERFDLFNSFTRNFVFPLV